MPSHWDKKGEELIVKSKYKELNSIGSVDTQVESIKDYTRVKTTWFYTSDEPTLDPFSMR